jgi:hypothetical protein
MITDKAFSNFHCNAWFAQLREDEYDSTQSLSIVSLSRKDLPDAPRAQAVTEVSDRDGTAQHIVPQAGRFTLEPGVAQEQPGTKKLQVK